MANVIYHPGNSNLSGPGVNIPSSSSVGSYNGGTEPHNSTTIIGPGSSGSGGSGSYIPEENVRMNDMIPALYSGTGFDIDKYFDVYTEYMNNLMKEQSKYNDQYLEKYMKWNQDLYKSAQDFEKMMSDTAIQRQVQDMINAGINPVLAAGYQGAQVPSVSAPYVSISPSSALSSAISAGASSLGSGMSAMASMYGAQMARGSAFDVASMNNSTQFGITQMITEREYRLAEMANSNAIYIHELDNSAKAELEKSLQDERFKHDYDVLDQQLMNDLTRYAEQHNYTVDLQDKQLINQWIQDRTSLGHSMIADLSREFMFNSRGSEYKTAAVLLDKKYGGALFSSALFNNIR